MNEWMNGMNKIMNEWNGMNKIMNEWMEWIK